MLDDPVNHPLHYTDGNYEVIDFIEDYRLGFHYGNAVKYISRAGKKDFGKRAEDLNKAIWYLTRACHHRNSNFVKCYREHPPIDIDDYCIEKGLSENLTNAIHLIVETNDPVSAKWWIEEEIKNPMVVREELI